MMFLEEATLGQLNLTQAQGLNVIAYEIGSPEVREVVRYRSNADGAVDDTMFVGQRAVTVTLRLDQTKFPTQALLDLLLPYMSPRYRPRLVWTIQDALDYCSSGTLPAARSLELRGIGAPTVISAPGRYQTIVCQWKAESFIGSEDLNCQTFLPSGASEAGRTYNRTFNYTYPATLPSGSALLHNAGNALAQWTMTIFGVIDDPQVTVNGVTVTTTAVPVLTSQTLNFDTLQRTIRINNDPAFSKYGSTNFTSWTWDSLLMQPGDNLFRVQAGASAPSSSCLVTVCWRDSWL